MNKRRRKNSHYALFLFDYALFEPRTLAFQVWVLSDDMGHGVTVNSGRVADMDGYVIAND